MAVAMEVDEVSPLVQMLEDAKATSLTSPDKSIPLFREIIASESEAEDAIKAQEGAVYALGKLFVKLGRSADLAKLTKEIRPFCANLPKAKTAKIVRTLIDLVAKIEGTMDLQIELCNDCIAWCKEEKRTFLRQRVETKLASLYMNVKKYPDALALLDVLLKEVKKLDDKLLLVEIYLIECRTQLILGHIPKSKAALTAGKTNANAIHCPPLMQAEIDLLSGIIHAREKDFTTAFSYFYEACEGYHQHDESQAPLALKYQLMAKIMAGEAADVPSLISSKVGMKYMSVSVEALQAVAKCHQDRSLEEFEQVVQKYKKELQEDNVISYHIKDLNEAMLEQNLLRLIEPYSRVEVAHIAKLIKLPTERIQQKLSEMILDGNLKGTLDQSIGVLIIFDEEPISDSYKNVLGCLRNTSDALDTMHEKALQLA